MARPKTGWRIAALFVLVVCLLCAVWFSSRIVLGEHTIGKGLGIAASDAKAAQYLSQFESQQFAESVLRRVETQDAALASLNEEQGRLAIKVNIARNGGVWLNYSFAGYSLVEFNASQWGFKHEATETAEVRARNEVVYAAIVAELDRVVWRLNNL